MYNVSTISARNYTTVRETMTTVPVPSSNWCPTVCYPFPLGGKTAKFQKLQKQHLPRPPCASTSQVRKVTVRPGPGACAIIIQTATVLVFERICYGQSR